MLKSTGIFPDIQRYYVPLQYTFALKFERVAESSGLEYREV